MARFMAIFFSKNFLLSFYGFSLPTSFLTASRSFAELWITIELSACLRSSRRSPFLFYRLELTSLLDSTFPIWPILRRATIRAFRSILLGFAVRWFVLAPFAYLRFVSKRSTNSKIRRLDIKINLD